MGYYVCTIDSSIFLDKNHFDSVYQKMCELNNHDELKRGGSYPASNHTEKYNPNKWFSWMPYDYPDQYADMLKILVALGFDYKLDDDGNLVDLVYEYNKTGNEDYFLCCFAGYIRPGSYITFKGEDEEYYRYTFDETHMFLERGTVAVNYEFAELYEFAQMTTGDKYLEEFRKNLEIKYSEKSNF